MDYSGVARLPGVGVGLSDNKVARMLSKTAALRSKCQALAILALSGKEKMWLLMSKFPGLLIIVAMVLACQTQARSFGASWGESDWSVNAGPFDCSLVHKVPGFGQVALNRKAGGDESLQLQQQGKEGFPSGAIRVQAVPPSWRSDLPTVNLGLFNQGAARIPLQLSSGQLPALLKQLEQGHQLVLSGLQAADGEIFRVLISPRNFTSAYQRYRSCLSQLIPDSFEQMARITLYYQRNATELSANSKIQLDRMARYSQADKQVLGVIVDAHSDSRASEEESRDESRTQASLITEYLVGKGLSLDMITSRWHGDKYPAASNGDEQGRAKNRRVTLRLENAETRVAREKRIAKHKQDVAQQSSSAAARDTNIQGLTLKELERMVESQDLSSGKQPQK